MIYLLSALVFVFSVTGVQASQIRNSIEIRSNTGGNEVNGQTDGAEVKTGSTTTSVNIKNGQTQTDQSISESGTSETNISIQNSDGDATAEVTVNNRQVTLEQVNGKTKLTTIDSNGNQSTRSVQSGETVQFQFEDGTSIKVSPTTDGFNLSQNSTTATTRVPVTIDTETEQVLLPTDSGLVALTLMPETAIQLPEVQDRLDQITSIELLTAKTSQTPAYSISGTQTKRLLGLFNVSINKSLNLDTHSLEATETISNSVDQWLNRFSI